MAKSSSEVQLLELKDMISQRKRKMASTLTFLGGSFATTSI